jgi:hypothetical protein
MISRVSGVQTLVRASMVVAALVVVTSVVPLSASDPTALSVLPGRPKSGEITITRGLN